LKYDGRVFNMLPKVELTSSAKVESQFVDNKVGIVDFILLISVS
jgi:hypothetical protein